MGKELRHIALGAALLGVVGCGDESGQAGPSDDGALGSADAGSRPLDQVTVSRYMAAMKEIQARGAGVESEFGADPSSFQRFAAGLEVREEWEEIIEEHDLDAQSFMGVHVALAKAFGKLMMDEQLASLAEQQKAAFEQMKRSMGEEAARQMLEAQKGALSAATSAFDDVPPGDVVLVEKVMPQLRALWRRE